MPEIDLPFAKAAHEEVDAKLLPAGMLSHVENARIRKDLRVEPRYGYVVKANLPTGILATPAQGPTEVTTISARTTSASPPLVNTLTDAGMWASQGCPVTLGDLGGVQRYPVQRHPSGNVCQSDCCYAGGYLWYVTAAILSAVWTVELVGVRPETHACVLRTSWTVDNAGTALTVRMAATTATLFVVYGNGSVPCISCVRVTLATLGVAAPVQLFP